MGEPRGYLSVKNFDQYQHYKHRNPPWIKLYYSLLDDPHFLALDEVQQGRYMKLLLVASKQNNRILNDAEYVGRMLRLSGKVDVTPLIQSGFLIASRKHTASNNLARRKRTCPSESSSSETEITETEKQSPLSRADRWKGWMLTDELRSWLRRQGVPDEQHVLLFEECRSYWLDQPEKKRRSDCDRTFQTHILKLKGQGMFKHQGGVVL